MGKRKQGGSDIFEALEHQQRTAHFPAASDGPACVSFYGSIIERFDAAMMKADTAAALEAKAECSLYLDHVYAPFKDSRGLCHNDVSRQLAKSYRAPDGEVPKWGQEGTFTIPVGSVPVRVEVEHLCGLGMFGQNLMPHFSIYIVEKHRLFLSHTGYRSFFPSMSSTEPGMTVADAIGRVLREHVQREMKGKLEEYDPYKGYSPKYRRDRMIADGIISEDAAPEPERAAEGEPVEDDDLVCDGCDASLTIVDEYTENECGTFCARCFVAHTRDCDGCESDMIEDHGGMHPCPTRSGRALLPEHQALKESISGYSGENEESTDNNINTAPDEAVFGQSQMCLF